jgi:hypothetical protein
MPIINQINQTRFRSLRWGNDRPGHGDSGQPYIKVDLKKIDSLGNQIRFAHFDEGFIRGGLIGSTVHAATDLIRVAKFMGDFPKGPLFITKQVGLQLTNPRLEVNPNPLGMIAGTSRLANAINAGISVINKIDSEIGATRIYNLGINTLAQVPVGHLGIHIQRHGLTPIRNDYNTYYNTVRPEHQWKDDNRLVKLTKKFFPEGVIISNRNIATTKKTLLQRIGNFFSTNVPFLNGNQMIIDQYIGGPNSTYGIGRTTIRRYDNTDNSAKTIDALIKADAVTKNLTFQDGDNATPSKFEIADRHFGLTTQYDDKDLPKTTRLIDNNVIIYSANGKKFQDLKSRLENQKNKQKEFSAGKKFEGGPIVKTENHKVTGWNTQYQTSNIETRVGVTGGTKDLINLTPLFESNKPLPDNTILRMSGTKIKMRDLVKFRIEAVDSDDPNKSIWMIFRAYLKGFQDSYNPSDISFKYIGRGEQFYIRDSFTRQISLNFKVAALSGAEMEIMYQKLNFLASNATADYSSQNLMRTPMMKLTVGNYVYREACLLSGLTFTVADETPWEIAMTEPEGGKLMYELPMILDVHASFNMIHNFLPQKSVGEAPFILNKPVEDSLTSPEAIGIDNPWLKIKTRNGTYTKDPIQPDKP